LLLPRANWRKEIVLFALILCLFRLQEPEIFRKVILSDLSEGPSVRIGAVYGNPEDTRDPLNPSNKGRNPRVVDAARKVMSFPLKAGGAQLSYGNGQPMRTPQGAPVRAASPVFLNYGIRLERDGRTYFMAWETNSADPADSPTKNATGWVAADDMTDDGAAAAKAAIPRRLGRLERPIARDASGMPRTCIVNGINVTRRLAGVLIPPFPPVTGLRRGVLSVRAVCANASSRSQYWRSCSERRYDNRRGSTWI
jgi:hypothetical protein